MIEFTYEGPVMEFEKCIEHKWRGTTYAVSMKKARSNLIYQYKKQTGRSPTAKISLPGKIRVTPNERS